MRPCIEKDRANLKCVTEYSQHIEKNYETFFTAFFYVLGMFHKKSIFLCIYSLVCE